MAIRDNTSVYIFRDGKTREFYAKTVRSLAGETLPEYGEDKREMLADALEKAFPELRDLAADLRSDVYIPQEYVTSVIMPAIERYNAASVSYRTRWLIFDASKNTFIQINDKTRLARLSSDEERLENTDYDGRFNYAEMVKHVRGYSERAVASYIVFVCPECGKPGYGELVRGKATCDGCGKIIQERDECVKAKYGTIAEAAGRALQLGGKPETESEELPQKFYYGEKLYGFGAPDAKMLFSALLRDYAAYELFTSSSVDGVMCVDGFTKKYESYLSGLHRNGVRTELYDGREQFISIARAERLNADDAFYKYFCENGFCSGLDRRYSGKRYTFATPAEYATALATGKGELNAALVGMFDTLTCEFFLGGEYEPTRSEITRFVYERTGRLMYFGTDGGKVESTDFGKTFFQDLVRRDGQTEIRDLFLQTLIANYKLWDKVKGGYDYADSYDGVRKDYYDRLCFTEYAVSGHRRLKYGRLEIQNSEDGVRAIKRIIVNAYTRGGSAEYAELVELLELPLIDKLDAVFSATVGDESFIDGVRARMDKAAVPLELYLFCAEARDKRTVEVVYGGATDTVLGHAKREVKKDRGEGLRAFLLDRDVKSALEYMYGKDAVERNRMQARSQFDALCAAISKLKTSGGKPKGR